MDVIIIILFCPTVRINKLIFHKKNTILKNLKMQVNEKILQSELFEFLLLYHRMILFLPIDCKNR